MKTNKTPILILIAVLIIAAVAWASYYAGKKNNQINQSTENNTIQPVVKENTDVFGLANTDMIVFTSDKLRIEFTYPKNISINNITTKTLVSVTESGNRLDVSAEGLGGYYALIYHKNSNETFEQSILRQLVKLEYQNKPCSVKKFDDNYYEVTFPGDMGDAGGWTKEGYDNAKKCGQDPSLLQVVADPTSGGFYVATRGTHDPSFGVANSSNWWPKGIKFIPTL